MAKLNIVPPPQALDTPACAPLTQVMKDLQDGSLGSAMFFWEVYEAQGSLVTVVVVPGDVPFATSVASPHMLRSTSESVPQKSFA